jgi:hypothetical protein
MTTPTDDVTLAYHATTEAASLLDELCDAYADAYGAVLGEDRREKSSAFRERATAALQAVSYSLVTAHVGNQLVGFAFGYSLRPERGWWDGPVRRVWANPACWAVCRPIEWVRITRRRRPSTIAVVSNAVRFSSV